MISGGDITDDFLFLVSFSVFHINIMGIYHFYKQRYFNFLIKIELVISSYKIFNFYFIFRTFF